MTVFRVRPGNGLLKPSGTGRKKIALSPGCFLFSDRPAARGDADRPIAASGCRGVAGPSLRVCVKSRCRLREDSLPERIRFAPASFYIYSRTSSTAAGRRGAGGVPGLAMIGCTAMTGEVRKTVSKSIGGWATDGFKGKPHRLADCPPEERNADQLFRGFFLVICTV